MTGRVVCKSGGFLPHGEPCPHYRKEDNSCQLPEADSCVFQHVTFMDDEVTQSEKVEVPSELVVQYQALRNTQNPYSLFTEQSFECVKLALQIIDRVNPLHFNDQNPGREAQAQAYMQDPNQLEQDALALTSLHATISALATKIEGDSKKAVQHKRVMYAKKYQKIRENVKNMIRARITDKGIDSLITMDEDYQQACTITNDEESWARILHSMASTVIEHVNMLKRRVDSLRHEYTRSGRT